MKLTFDCSHYHFEEVRVCCGSEAEHALSKYVKNGLAKSALTGYRRLGLAACPIFGLGERIVGGNSFCWPRSPLLAHHSPGQT